MIKSRIVQSNSELFKWKHGLKKHPLYDVWGKIKARCFNPQDKDYRDYGGRGISMPEEWTLDFKAFYNWAIASGYKKGLEIDRKENDGDYTPGNCRFVTRSQNMRNTRRNNVIEFKGEKRCIAEWAEITGIPRYTIWGRINRLKWPVETALTRPVRSGHVIGRTRKVV